MAERDGAGARRIRPAHALPCASPALPSAQVGVLAEELAIDPNIKLKGPPAPAAKQHVSPALASTVEDAPEDTALLAMQTEFLAMYPDVNKELWKRAKMMAMKAQPPA